MNTSFLLPAVIVIALTAADTAQAGPVRARIRREVAAKNKHVEPDERAAGADARLAAMRRVIESGIASGKLTKAEAGSLTRELEGIERREEQYRRSMDKVTRGERAALHRDIGDLHQRLHEKTRNAAEAPDKK